MVWGRRRDFLPGSQEVKWRDGNPADERLAAWVHHRLQHAFRPRPGECQGPASAADASR